MSKKIVALLMALVLVFAMTACAKTETPAPAESSAPAESADAPETPAAEEDDGEIYTLNYYQIGNQDTNTREAVQDAINAYIEPLIGADVEFSIIGWAIGIPRR